MAYLNLLATGRWWPKQLALFQEVYKEAPPVTNGLIISLLCFSIFFFLTDNLLLCFLQSEKNTALSKLAELEHEVSDSNSQVSSLQTKLADSQSKIKELEVTLSNKLVQQSADVSTREEELRKNIEKISSLEKDVEEQKEAKTSLQKELKTTVSLNWSKCNLLRVTKETFFQTLLIQYNLFFAQ